MIRASHLIRVYFRYSARPTHLFGRGRPRHSLMYACSSERQAAMADMPGADHAHAVQRAF
eukprot:scaffold207207_cov35-Tisochrysis_lutea.AAC.3